MSIPLRGHSDSIVDDNDDNVDGDIDDNVSRNLLYWFNIRVNHYVN